MLPTHLSAQKQCRKSAAHERRSRQRQSLEKKARKSIAQYPVVTVMLNTEDFEKLSQLNRLEVQLRGAKLMGPPEPRMSSCRERAVRLGLDRYRSLHNRYTARRAVQSHNHGAHVTVELLPVCRVIDDPVVPRVTLQLFCGPHRRPSAVRRPFFLVGRPCTGLHRDVIHCVALQYFMYVGKVPLVSVRPHSHPPATSSHTPAPVAVMSLGLLLCL